MNRLTASLSSTKIELGGQLLPSSFARLFLFYTMDKVILRTIIFKVQTTTLKQFCNVLPGQLRPGVKYPFNYSFPGRGLHISIFSKLMYTFTKLLIIKFGHPHFKWLIPTHIWCLNIFCAPIWNDHAIYIHFFKPFLTIFVIWY